MASLKSTPDFTFGFSIIFGLLLIACSILGFQASVWYGPLLGGVALVTGLGLVITGFLGRSFPFTKDQ